MLLLSLQKLTDSTSHCSVPGQFLSQFRVGQSVEYYSTSRRRWFETVVVCCNANGTIDVACRANANPALLRFVSDTDRSAEVETPEVSFDVGSRVEYFSGSLNAWVMSYVKGLNPDGTYQLNTKKAADPSRIRRLIFPAPKIDSPEKGLVCSLVDLPHIHADRGIDLSVLKRHIARAMSLKGDYRLEKMGGFSGGQNEGIWFLSLGNEKLYCLKLVVNHRRFQSIPTEREAYLLLMGAFPALIATDSCLTFPTHVLTGLPGLDLIAMPVARGRRMAEVIGHAIPDLEKISQIFSATGTQLSRFHKQYPHWQHGDFQTSNIFITENCLVTFIDLAGMKKGRSKIDVEYFCESIRLLAKTYGSEFERVASTAFLDGYGKT